MFAALLWRAMLALVAALALLACWALLSLWPLRLAHARDLEGRYANSPLRSWFDQLASKKGLCCSFADGFSLADVDWDVQCANGAFAQCRYRVRIDGAWTDVPDEAVVTEPNRYGAAVVWPFKDESGVTQIRCFMPGAGT